MLYTLCLKWHSPQSSSVSSSPPIQSRCRSHFSLRAMQVVVAHWNSCRLHVLSTGRSANTTTAPNVMTCFRSVLSHSSCGLFTEGSSLRITFHGARHFQRADFSLWSGGVLGFLVLTLGSGTGILHPVTQTTLFVIEPHPNVSRTTGGAASEASEPRLECDTRRSASQASHSASCFKGFTQRSQPDYSHV